MKIFDSSVLSCFAPEVATIPLCGFGSGERGDPLPEVLRSTVEQLSGFDMSDVRVFYDSTLPAQVNARAFAYGTDIYLGPGTEDALTHEVWHVVQQKQGWVKVTGMVNGLPLNSEHFLEDEAEVMGHMVAKKGFVTESRSFSSRMRCKRSIAEPVIQRMPQDITIPSKDGSIPGGYKIKSPEGLRESLNDYYGLKGSNTPYLREVTTEIYYISTKRAYKDWDELAKEVKRRSFGYSHYRMMQDEYNDCQRKKKIFDNALDEFWKKQNEEIRIKNKQIEEENKEGTTIDNYERKPYLNSMSLSAAKELFIVDNPINFVTYDKAFRYKSSLTWQRPLLQWLGGKIKPPEEASNLNCWEAVLYYAAKAKLIDKKYVTWAVNDSDVLGSKTKISWDQIKVKLKEFRKIESTVEDQEPPSPANIDPILNFINEISHSYWKSSDILHDPIYYKGDLYPVLPEPDIVPTGMILIFNYGDHVALTTGFVEKIKNEAAQKVYNRKYGIGMLEIDGPVGNQMSLTTVEDIMLHAGYRKAIFFAWLPNHPPLNINKKFRYSKPRGRGLDSVTLKAITKESSDIYGDKKLKNILYNK